MNTSTKQFPLRLPSTLHETIKRMAEETRRSVNMMIVHILETEAKNRQHIDTKVDSEHSHN